jgi:hypothetical protein
MTILAIIGGANGLAAIELHTAGSLYLKEKGGNGIIDKHECLGDGTRATFHDLSSGSKRDQSPGDNAPDEPLTAQLGTKLAKINLDKI